MSELVHRDTADGVATTTLDSPANRNALSAQLRGELIAHLALAGVKDLLRRARPAVMSDDLAEMTALSAGYFTGTEGQEGIRAFGEKRRPVWGGHAEPTSLTDGRTAR